MGRICYTTRCRPRAGNWYRGLQRFGYLPLFVLLFMFPAGDLSSSSRLPS